MRRHSTLESPTSLSHPPPPHPPTGNAHQELRAIRELCSRRVFPALSGPIRGTDSREIHHVGRSHAASSSLSLINHGTPTHNQIGSLCFAGEWPEEFTDDHMTPRTYTHAHTHMHYGSSRNTCQPGGPVTSTPRTAGFALTSTRGRAVRC